MRYGIFSDVHSNLEALGAVFDAYHGEEIDKYLCIGDVVGYAANPEECIDKISALADITVAGNHDWASVDLVSVDYFNHTAREAIIWTKQKLDDKRRYFLLSLKLVYKNDDLTLVHGTLDEPAEFNYMVNMHLAAQTFKLLKGNICFVGHSHVAGVFIEDRLGRIMYLDDDTISVNEENKYIVNAGSVGQPRDDNPKAAFCIYDTFKKQVQIKRVDYDIKVARNKIVAAGLPRFLGDRLLRGM